MLLLVCCLVCSALNTVCVQENLLCMLLSIGYKSWCVCHRIRSDCMCVLWISLVCLCSVRADSRCGLGRWRAVFSMMDGRFVLSSSLFLLSVCITQISPVHISRPSFCRESRPILFNPANSTHLNSVYTSGRAVAFRPERIKKHWVCIHRTAGIHHERPWWMSI